MIMLKKTHIEEVRYLKKEIMRLQLQLIDVLRSEAKLRDEKSYLQAKVDKFEKYISNLENTITSSEV
nr:MAG TPA: hypothetical protein [Caudoviricetes sp.]